MSALREALGIFDRDEARNRGYLSIIERAEVELEAFEALTHFADQYVRWIDGEPQPTYPEDTRERSTQRRLDRLRDALLDLDEVSRGTTSVRPQADVPKFGSDVVYEGDA